MTRSTLAIAALTLALHVAATSPARAQAQPSAATAATATVTVPTSPQRTSEDLNFQGGATTMPSPSDTVFGTSSAFRRRLFGHGILFRVNVVPRVTMNLLDRPVPKADQVYIGHRPTWILGINPTLTADLRQLGLRQAQLHVSLGLRRTNWNPAGPDTLALSTMYFFKRWGDRRVEMKAGYLTNDLEFVGLQVGGSTSTGAQGVYANLPNEVGTSYFPLTAPALNVRVRTSARTYIKTGVQRSLDAAGGLSTERRNPTGFNVTVAGNGAVVLNEVGFQRASSAGTPQTWVRAGLITNTTEYTNRATGEKEAGNYCAYALVDYQVRQPDPASPARGLYFGMSAMTVPDRFNAYTRYVEARLYQRAPFASRASDVLTFVASYRVHSRTITDAMVGAGKTVWRGSGTVTGTYTAHVSPGNYLSLSLGYVRGAALTPRVKDSMTFTTNWSLYL